MSGAVGCSLGTFFIDISYQVYSSPYHCTLHVMYRVYWTHLMYSIVHSYVLAIPRAAILRIRYLCTFNRSSKRVGAHWLRLGRIISGHTAHFCNVYLSFCLRVQVLVGDRLQFFVRPLRDFDVLRLPFRG